MFSFPKLLLLVPNPEDLPIKDELFKDNFINLHNSYIESKIKIYDFIDGIIGLFDDYEELKEQKEKIISELNKNRSDEYLIIKGFRIKFKNISEYEKLRLNDVLNEFYEKMIKEIKTNKKEFEQMIKDFNYYDNSAFAQCFRCVNQCFKWRDLNDYMINEKDIKEQVKNWFRSVCLKNK